MLREAKTIRNIALYSSNDSRAAFVHFKKNHKIGAITPDEWQKYRNFVEISNSEKLIYTICEIYSEAESRTEEGVYRYKRPMKNLILTGINPQRV